MAGKYGQPCWFCGGEVVERRVTVTRQRDGRVVVIENIPAEVCGDCGERVFLPEQVEKMERILRGEEEPETYQRVPVHRVP